MYCIWGSVFPVVCICGGDRGWALIALVAYCALIALIPLYALYAFYALEADEALWALRALYALDALGTNAALWAEITNVSSNALRAFDACGAGIAFINGTLVSLDAMIAGWAC